MYIVVLQVFVSDKVMNIHLNDGSGIVEITAPTIILGTGGYSNIPNVPGLKEAGFLSSESLFGDKFPKQPYKIACSTRCRPYRRRILVTYLMQLVLKFTTST